MPYYHMMNWFPFMGIGTLVTWLIFLVIAYLVYKDAEMRGKNGLLWGLAVLVPWIGIIFLILYLILREGGHFTDSKMTPQELLDERYAKGELTREQYLQMKEDIKKNQ
jgi:putative membrane protein